VQALSAHFALNALRHYGLLASNQISRVLLDAALSVRAAKTGSVKSSNWKKLRAKRAAGQFAYRAYCLAFFQCGSLLFQPRIDH